MFHNFLLTLVLFFFFSVTCSFCLCGTMCVIFWPFVYVAVYPFGSFRGRLAVGPWPAIGPDIMISCIAKNWIIKNSCLSRFAQPVRSWSSLRLKRVKILKNPDPSYIASATLIIMAATTGRIYVCSSRFFDHSQ